MRVIEIIVTPKGKTAVQTLGFVGPTCCDESKYLEEALGQRLTESRTAQFYQAEAKENQQQQQT